MKKFKEMNLNELNTQLIKDNGFENPTPIQSQVLPMALKGKDIVGISQTGTGKTHAFIIPILEKLNVSKECVQAVITAPTRELASQIYKNLQKVNNIDPNIRIKLVTGGIDKNKMIASLTKQPHIVVGTPGRIKDLFIDEAVLRVDSADILVVDEADMTLEFGFIEEVDAIAGKMKASLQMMVFSATIPESLKPFLKKYMKNPQHIEISEKHALSPQIEHVMVSCKHRPYDEVLLSIMDGFKPYVCLIFANTRIDAANVARTLRDNGKEVIELHGGLQPRQRKIAMRQLSENNYTYIVCTDIAARGIDIDAVSHVVSLGLPSELEYYIHRSGRCGRAGREGTCYLLYQDSDEVNINTLRKSDKIEFIPRSYKDGVWRDLKIVEKKKHYSKDDELEREIAKVVTRKNEKVKPGYKKKKAAEIDRIKRKKKREMIKTDIKTRQKIRGKASVIAARSK